MLIRSGWNCDQVWAMRSSREPTRTIVRTLCAPWDIVAQLVPSQRLMQDRSVSAPDKAIEIDLYHTSG